MRKALSVAALLISLQVFCMKIFVNIPIEGGVKKITLDTKPSDDILQIRYLIQEQENITPESYDLYFKDKFLEDNRTLSDYNIQKESVLDVVMKSTLSAADFNKSLKSYFDISNHSLNFIGLSSEKGYVLVYDLSGRLIERITIDNQKSKYQINSKGALLLNIVLNNRPFKNMKVINN